MKEGKEVAPRMTQGHVRAEAQRLCLAARRPNCLPLVLSFSPLTAAALAAIIPFRIKGHKILVSGRPLSSTVLVATEASF